GSVGITLGLVAPAGCSSNHDAPAEPPEPAMVTSGAVDPGALVQTTANSTVGVLLDEIPANIRDRVAQDTIAQTNDFWVARATRQLQLTTYRLVFRYEYYMAQMMTKKQQLPLPPPSIWQFTFNGPAHRATIDGHDLVVIDYTFNSTLL